MVGTALEVLTACMLLLRPVETCWRSGIADRAAFLIDAAAYYGSLRTALLQARRSDLIVGWDIDSRTRLTASDPAADELPATLLPFLNHLLMRRPELHIHALAWDFSMIYAFERESLPSYRFGWKGHPRLHFALDGHHPPGASHHQKMVVIDDRVAFSGGMDLTIRRWDTPEHQVNDRRRLDPAGMPYHPMHDVQVAVSGEIAVVLGDLARERWKAGTGQTLEPAKPQVMHTTADDPWPASLEPDACNVRLGVARTIGPLPAGTPPVREIERLTLDAISGAQRSIFIENQYLTATSVSLALARRLSEADGPEVVIIVPQVETGWLERGSMGILRARLLERLRQADVHGRLRVLYPVVPGSDGPQPVGVHSKVLVVDDRLLKVGSANMSNRSMALDTECDLALESTDAGDESTSATIANVRARLLAEHLGCEPADVMREHRVRGTLRATIEALGGGSRRLVELGNVPAAPVDLALLDGMVCDPEKPLAPEILVDALVPAECKHPARRGLLVWAGIALSLLMIGAVWRLPGLREWASVDQFVAWGQVLQDSPGGVWLFFGAYVVAAAAFAPVTLLIAATALVLDPLTAFLVAYGGSIAGASVTYWIGRAVGARPLRRFISPRMRRFRSSIQRGSFLAVTAARLLPVGNFAMINLLAGALLVPFPGFVMGNLVGLLPGILALSLLADRLGSAVTHPSALNLGLVALALAAAVALVWWARRVLRSGGPRMWRPEGQS